MVASMHTAAQQELVRAIVGMRKKAGLSQRGLAELLGREQNYLGRIETGQRRVDLVELVQICQACGADPNAEIPRLVRQIAESVPRRRRRG
ncbi:MAG TPA: helix-turn-helix transcriptional regulator [Tepidisphaeraceae bacterium]|jgi:transcriptional regulator with XRE-family HTH domain|nr:helix-turn-helix transcriptional regulator [Tepidisphaeraceae bacterium]